MTDSRKVKSNAPGVGAKTSLEEAAYTSIRTVMDEVAKLIQRISPLTGERLQIGAGLIEIKAQGPHGLYTQFLEVGNDVEFASIRSNKAIVYDKKGLSRRVYGDCRIGWQKADQSVNRDVASQINVFHKRGQSPSPRSPELISPLFINKTSHPSNVRRSRPCAHHSQFAPPS